ncbi:polymorphic toxin-type HINT domain-containing protein [Archangium violaceum]|uniref:polymorphic toxin-type HINT domain-containing protein n=1 Tax=Archangium violaceum TaxID=83451 RepID=UPI00126A4422|nr:polymorphic toxin-type HINT domain-containing protein [Archangium violaceum]
MKQPSVLAGVLACVCLALATPALASGPLEDMLVQPPQLSAPQRGSLVGQLASTAFGPADVSRGAFSLPSPFSVPEDRGMLLASVMPTYSPDSGASEWGVGWSNSLSLERWRAKGDPDYLTDDLSSPWGRLAKGTDGAWYPQGLSTLARVVVDGSTATAYLPDGSTWTFGGTARVNTPRGTYAWYLTDVVTALGRRTRLEWAPNASGRLFLQRVRYGGTGTDFQYRLELQYQPVAIPFVDYRSGVGLSLDRRVASLTVFSRDQNTGADAERWSYTLTHEGDGFGPAFFLTQVSQRFASGETPPPTRYTYHSARQKLLQPEWFTNPRLDAVLQYFGEDAFQPQKATFLDVDADGLLDFEHAYDGTLVRQSTTGFTLEPLDPASSSTFYGCRSPASHNNLPRHLAQMFPDQRSFQVVWLEFNPVSSSTDLAVCERSGQLLHGSQLPGIWELDANTRLVDLDRDHRPELLRVEAGGFEVLPNTTTGTTISFGAARQGTLASASGGTYQPLASWVQDMNGDSMPDIVVRHSGGLAVWWGLGQLSFEPIAQEYSLINLSDNYVSPEGYAFHFMDANRDGLTDVLLVAQADVRLFVSSGLYFKEVDVPSLYYLGYGSTPPVVGDFRGSGNTEVAYAYYGLGYGVALEAPETGLMATADDGRGTLVRFTYARGPAGLDVRQRPAVLSFLTVESSGYDSVQYGYTYATPTHHSVGRFLVGYDTVVRQDGVVTVTEDFLNGDTYAGLSSSSTEQDARTPDLRTLASRKYEDVFFRGLPWKRLEEEHQGWTNGAGTTTLKEHTEYLDYEADVCPSYTVRHTSSGTLTTQRRRAVVSGLSQHLHCLEDRLILSGRHSDDTLNFDHEAWLTRNTVGLVERVESLGEDGLLTLQEVHYRPDYSVEYVSQPGRGSTLFELEPGGTLLRKVTSPDGSVLEVTARDARTDAILALASRHGTQSYTQFFRHDGQERLLKQWDSLGNATETNPSLLLAYEFATALEPAAVHLTTLVEALSGAKRRSVEWSTAGGEQVASAQLIPEGWAFDGVTTRHPALRETRTHNRPTEPASTNLGGFTHAAMRTGIQRVGSTRLAGFGHAVESLSKQHSDVERQVVSSLGLDAGLLRRESLENATYRTRSWMNASDEVLRREQADGTTYAFDRDALGRVRRVHLPDGKTHSVTHDKHGRVKQVVREGLATLVYDYAPTTGLLSSLRHLSANGVAQRSETWTYDAIGRKEVELHTDLVLGTTRSYRFYYDGATPDAPARRTYLGEVSAVQGEGYLKTMDYRADGKLARYVLRLDGWRTVESDLEYTDSGDLKQEAISVRAADGTLLSVSTKEQRWDTYGRLWQVWLNGNPLATFGYNANGQAAQASFVSGDSVLLGYDPLTRRRLSQTQTTAGWSSSNSFRFNARGFLDVESFVVGGKNLQRSYGYSPQGFLTSAHDAEHAYDYEFDGFGLPMAIEEAGVRRELIPGSGTLTAGAVTYTFDALGRTSAKGDLTFQYGPNGHLERATRGANEWRFLYDETGQRLLKLTGTTPVAAYLREGAYLDASGLAEPFKFAGQLVGLVQGGGFQMLAADARGTVMADLDGTARLASPFGNRTVRPDSSAVVDYVQKGFDADLGLIRMGVRDYDPELNRFLTPDPLFLAEPERCVDSPVECNLYGYAGGNPVAYVDPTGKALESIWDAASLAMGVASIASWDSNTSTLEKALDVVGVVADAAALAVPFVPGGAGAAIKAYRVGDKVVDAVKATDKTADALKAANRAETTGKMASKADDVGDGLKSAAKKGCEGKSCGIPGQCFVAGTQVLTKEGPKPIEEVRPGDLVWSRSDETGATDWRPVVQTFITPDQPVLKLELIEEASGQKSELGVTGEHPFWVKDLGWVGAGALQPGQRVASAHGGWLKVGTSTWEQTRTTVFNFEVAEYHTYFAGDLRAWVHNNCEPKHYIPDSPLPQQRVRDVDIPTPDPRAEGRAHTTLGGRDGSDGVRYRQSATFPENTWPKANGQDVPMSRVDWHNHGRPQDHTNPHQHQFTYDTQSRQWTAGEQKPFYPSM